MSILKGPTFQAPSRPTVSFGAPIPEASTVPKSSTDAGQVSLGNAYEFDYFNGSQIGIYIGDILVDDIASIQFQVSQSKRPIYGYASQYFHTVAAGQVLVEGNFAIPFKESNYLIATLQRYDGHFPIHEEKGSKQHRVLRESIERRVMREYGGQVGETREHTVFRRKTLGQFPSETLRGTGEFPPEESSYEWYRDLGALADEDFERVAEIYEDQLWHSRRKDREYNTSNLTGDITDSDVHTHRRADQYPEFDIWVLYGDISNKAANHTIKKISDCHIIGQGQAIEVGGQVIGEQYSFLARNLL